MDITEQLLKIIDVKTSNVLSRSPFYPHEDFQKITFFTVKGYLSIEIDSKQYLHYFYNQEPFTERKDLYKVLGIQLYRWWNPFRPFAIDGSMCNWESVRKKVNEVMMTYHQTHQDAFNRRYEKRAAKTEKVLNKL